MKTLAIIVALLLVAGAVVYLLLEKRPRLRRLVRTCEADRRAARHRAGRLGDADAPPDAERRAGLPGGALSERQARLGAEDSTRLPPDELLARLRRIALAEPDTRELSGATATRAARFLQHTRLMRFPDTIDAEVLPVGDDESTLAIYSRSLVGRKDFGVNRARLERWLAALDAN